MALKYFCFDFSTTFLFYVYSKLFKKDILFEDAFDSRTVYLKVITSRIYIGFIVNMGTMITANLLLAKDLSKEVISGFVVFWTVLMIFVVCLNLFLPYSCSSICKITQTHSNIYLSKRGQMFSIYYRIVDMTVDTVLFSVFWNLSGLKWSQFMIVASVFYGVEMLTCIIVLGKSIRDYRSIQNVCENCNQRTSNENAKKKTTIEVSNNNIFKFHFFCYVVYCQNNIYCFIMIRELPHLS